MTIGGKPKKNEALRLLAPLRILGSGSRFARPE
jgi:hypothetical protein